MDNPVLNNYLESTRSLFRYYRDLGDKALAQISSDQIHWQPSPESNSVAIIVKHLSGNMLSRFSDFLTTDGEKPWRDRDAEFENDYAGKDELMDAWNKGWECFFAAVDPITEADLPKIIYIRNQGHTVMEALQRQLGHYASHVGQIIYLCRLLAGPGWQTLSIAKGGSNAFNAEKFSKEKDRGFFTGKS
jgi:hypothetical protein